jgi:cytochrome c biogenesis protein CcdA
MAYTIGSMVWIAAAILLFPYAYTPRDDRRARLMPRVLLVGLAVVFVVGVLTGFPSGGS